MWKEIYVLKHMFIKKNAAHTTLSKIHYIAQRDTIENLIFDLQLIFMKILIKFLLEWLTVKAVLWLVLSYNGQPRDWASGSNLT